MLFVETSKALLFAELFSYFSPYIQYFYFKNI